MQKFFFKRENFLTKKAPERFFLNSKFTHCMVQGTCPVKSISGEKNYLGPGVSSDGLNHF